VLASESPCPQLEACGNLTKLLPGETAYVSIVEYASTASRILDLGCMPGGTGPGLDDELARLVDGHVQYVAVLEEEARLGRAALGLMLYSTPPKSFRGALCDSVRMRPPRLPSLAQNCLACASPSASANRELGRSCRARRW
jgi:hypothetical protein